MTRSLYDPTVEQKGIEKGRLESRLEGKEDAAINFLKLGVSEDLISKGTGLSIEKINELKNKLN